MMTISLTVNLPPEVEQQLRAESGDLGSAVRESFAINLFRRGILTHHELGQVLGIDRFETDALLKRNGVTEYLLTHEDIDADVSGLKEFLGQHQP
jgi:predicted HTH domain antitoxin